MNSSEDYLAHLYRFVQPHVIVYSLPTWEARDVLNLLKANYLGKLEIISIVGWLGITLVKGFSFVVPIIAANSLPWVGQATTHMFVYYLLTINSTESLEYFESLN